MSEFIVPFARQEMLHHMLQIGGTAICELNRANDTVMAKLEVELTVQTAVIRAVVGPLTGELTLRRKDVGNHLRLSDFLQDIANGRLDNGPCQLSITEGSVVNPTLDQTAINQAIGALKLIPMFLNHPTAISRETLIGATSEALAMLEDLPPVSAELAEVFRQVDAAVQEGQVAYVTPTNNPVHPFGAVVADERGRLLATATGRSAKCLAELIRLQLLPLAEGAGERT